MYERIIEQLKDNCDCINEKDMKSGLVERSIGQLIQLISMLTCWTNRDETCATFLSTDRQELFDVNAIIECGHCEYGLMDVELFYNPIQQETLKVKLLKRDGIRFEEIELSEEEFSYNPYENVLMIDLRNYIGCQPCNCDVIEKVIVDYVAGYDVLPECLLPIFCDMLKFLIEMNRCECGCSTCDEQTVQDLVITTEDSEQQASTFDYIKSTIVKAYSRQLELISLCGRRKRFWGTVV